MSFRKQHLVPSWLPRVVGGATAIFFAAVLLGAPAWLLGVPLVDFAFRAFGRRQWAPFGLFASRVIGPRLRRPGPRPFSEWAPKQFASRLGLAATIATLWAYLSFQESSLGPVLAAMMLLLTGLEALAGYCVACKIYSLLGRLHLVESCPGGVCEVLAEDTE